MAVEPDVRTAGAALDALADAARALAEAATLREAAEAIAAAAARGAAADVVVARVANARGDQLAACAVQASSPALAAELEGSRIAADELPAEELDDRDTLPRPLRRAAERGQLEAALVVPLRPSDAPAVSLELLRAVGAFDEDERRVARLAAHQLAGAARAFAHETRAPADGALALAGEALAAATDASRTPEQLARLAVEATTASAALLWRVSENAAPVLAAAYGDDDGFEPLAAAADAAARALGERPPVAVDEGVFPGGAATSVTLQLGQPVIGALQLLFAADAAPGEADLPRLATFGIRAAQALRSSQQARTVELELARTRALLAVVGQAIAELSLEHTLRTAVRRTSELIGVDRLAVYLRREGRLASAAGLEVGGPHLAVAERLVELVLGPFRARAVLVIDDVRAEPHLAAAAGAAAEAGIEAAIAVPLIVHDELVGLLGIYPPLGRVVTENDVALLAALAGQLAVAVQNADLHEQATRQEEALKAALTEAEQAVQRLEALYEISRSFTEHLSLERLLGAVARTVVEALDVDAAVIRMSDDRREVLVPRAMHVGDERLADAAQTILFRPQTLRGERMQRLFADREPFLLDADAGELGGEHALLAPFLEKGWTGAVVPIHTPTEILAVLSVFSLHPERPVTETTLAGAVQISAQAALAIDNARLYQQQKEFADTMQRSLLPRDRPRVEGLDIGAAYAASAKVDVGGDVYDYLVLPDGRLAVVLGDVTGHGIDATADMAMAKFVFRSLAREHSEPGEFLSAANAVVVDEIATGKFITMLYLAVDGRTGSVAAAGAGHPPPRLLAADGTVQSIDARGLILGVAEGQRYEEVHATLERGGCLVLYTDGVIESRREGDQFGIERLDALLASERGLTPEELARAVIVTCRDHAGGELADDCAVVVVKRL